MIPAICGISLLQRTAHDVLLYLYLRNLVDAALMAATLERRVEKDPDDLLGELGSDDTRADRQHVRVVVLAGHARRIEVVAERGPHTVDLVGRDLLALAAAPEHDPHVGLAAHDRPGHRRAERRIVDRLGAVGAEIVDRVAPIGQHSHEVLLERIARVVTTDGNTHSGECNERGSRFPGLTRGCLRLRLPCAAWTAKRSFRA